MLKNERDVVKLFHNDYEGKKKNLINILHKKKENNVKSYKK